MVMSRFWSQSGGRESGALTTGRGVALVKACQCQWLVIGIAIGVPTVMSDRPGAGVDRPTGIINRHKTQFCLSVIILFLHIRSTGAQVAFSFLSSFFLAVLRPGSLSTVVQTAGAGLPHPVDLFIPFPPRPRWSRPHRAFVSSSSPFACSSSIFAVHIRPPTHIHRLCFQGKRTG